MLALEIIWWVAVFTVFWAMVGYPVSLVLLNRLFKKENVKDYEYEPTVQSRLMIT